jgi:cell shape-determining protein MreC
MTFFRKKSLVLTLFISLLAILVFSFSASAVENYDFIKFTEEDALTFVDNHNIDVPTKLSQSNNVGEFTLSTIL